MKIAFVSVPFTPGYFSVGFVFRKVPGEVEIGVQLVKWVFSIEFIWKNEETA